MTGYDRSFSLCPTLKTVRRRSCLRRFFLQGSPMDVPAPCKWEWPWLLLKFKFLWTTINSFKKCLNTVAKISIQLLLIDNWMDSSISISLKKKKPIIPINALHTRLLAFVNFCIDGLANPSFSAKLIIGIQGIWRSPTIFAFPFSNLFKPSHHFGIFFLGRWTHILFNRSETFNLYFLEGDESSHAAFEWIYCLLIK